MTDPLHPMAPIVELVKRLHAGRSLEERVWRARGKREGRRMQRMAMEQARTMPVEEIELVPGLIEQRLVDEEDAAPIEIYDNNNGCNDTTTGGAGGAGG